MAMSSWPLASDVSSFLADAGFDSLPSVDFGELVDRAVDEVHSTVGFSPFLAGASDDYPVRARDGVVVLDRPFASVTAVSVTGAAVEFMGCPQGVTPIPKLVLDGEVSGEAVVTGRVGFGLTVPIDLWYAVRDMAASFMVEMVGSSREDSVESVKQDTVTVKYRAGALPEQFAEILADRARMVFRRYQLVGMGG